jgi:hypothetical protein
MPHECMLNLLIGYMKFLFFQNYLSPFLVKLMVGAQIMGQFNVLNILICQFYQIQIHCNIKIIK